MSRPGFKDISVDTRAVHGCMGCDRVISNEEDRGRLSVTLYRIGPLGESGRSHSAASFSFTACENCTVELYRAVKMSKDNFKASPS